VLRRSLYRRSPPASPYLAFGRKAAANTPNDHLGKPKLAHTAPQRISSTVRETLLVQIPLEDSGKCRWIMEGTLARVPAM